jgi:deoxyribodipyrimidine photo-lyase
VDARKVFTPFYKLWQKVEKKPVDTTDLSLLLSSKNLTSARSAHCHPPYQEGQNTCNNDRNQIISHLSPGTNTYRPIDGWKKRLELDLQSYDTTRNELPNDGTTKLAPYIRFGLVSIRQVYRHYHGLV